MLAVIWVVWLERNRRVFKGEIRPTNTLVKEANDLGVSHNKTMEKQCVHREPKLVAWNPVHGFDVVLHVDGSSRGNPGRSGYGVVIRTSNGIWMDGVTGHIGTKTNLVAELHAILNGLRRLRYHNIRNSICYSDSTEAVNLTLSNRRDGVAHNNILRTIWNELSHFDTISIRHIYREGNMVADALARRGSRSLEFFTTWAFPPDDVKPLLPADAMGVLYPRL